MPIPITCSSCSAKIKAADRTAGRTLKCPRCKAVLHVPANPANGAVPQSDNGQDLFPVATDEIKTAEYTEPPPVRRLQSHDIPDPEEKECSYCGENIKWRAVKCKYCGEFLDGRGRVEDDDTRYVAPPDPGSASVGIASMVLGVVAFVVSVIPCLGQLTLPVSIVGLALSLIGLAVAISMGGRGIGYSIAGATLCFVALLIGLAWHRAATDFGKALDKAFNESSPTESSQEKPPAKKK